MLNPPFHIGAAVHAGIALKLFADAGRVLAPGGELWALWNSHLRHRPALERLVEPTRADRARPHVHGHGVGAKVEPIHIKFI